MSSPTPPVGESSPNFPFKIQGSHLINLETKQEYKIQRIEGQSVTDLDDDAIAGQCLGLLRTIYNHKQIPKTLENVSISKQGIKIPGGFQGLISQGTQLDKAGDEYEEDNNRVREVFEKHFTKVQESAHLEVEQRKIVFVEIPMPSLVKDFFKDFQKKGSVGREIGSWIKTIEKEDKAQPVPGFKELTEQKKQLDLLYDKVKDLESRSPLDSPEFLSAIREAHYSEYITLLHLMKCLESFSKFDPTEKASLEGLFTKTLETLSSSVTEDPLFSNKEILALIKAFDPSQIDSLMKIEKAKEHVKELEKKLLLADADLQKLSPGAKIEHIKARLKHELAVTQLFLIAEEQKLLAAIRKSLIDSIPKTRSFSLEEEKKLETIRQTSAALIRKSQVTNESRKKEKKAIPTDQQAILKTSMTPDNKFVNDILKKEVTDFLPSTEAIAAAEKMAPPPGQEDQVSRAKKIVDAISSSIKGLRSVGENVLAMFNLGNTLSSLKEVKSGLKNEIAQKNREIEAIQLEDIGEFSKGLKIEPIKVKIAELQNQIAVIDLQRQAAVMTKIIESVSLWQNFIKKAAQSIAIKKSSQEEEKIQQKLCQHFLTNAARDKTSVEKEAEAIAGEKHKSVFANLLRALPIDTTKRKEELEKRLKSSTDRFNLLEYEISLTQSEIKQARQRLAVLNNRYSSLIQKYDLNWNAVPKPFISQLKEWAQDALKGALTFNILSDTFPPHPSQLHMDKQYADIGYNAYEALEKWMKEAYSSTDQPAAYRDRLISEFYEWAYQHPSTATQLAGDMAQTLSILFGQGIFQSFLTTMKAKVFTYAILREIGVRDSPKIEEEKAMKFRALADLAKMLPKSTTGIKGIALTVAGTASGAAAGGPIGALLGFVAAYAPAVVDSATTKAVQEVNASITGVAGEFYLQTGRLLYNTFLTGVYVDSAVEKENLQLAKKAGAVYHAYNHPEGIMATIGRKVSDWWSTVKASRTFGEKIFRLAPAIAVGGVGVLAGLAVVAAIIGGPITWGLVALAITFVVPFLGASFPQLVKYANSYVFPDTVPIVKMREIEGFLKDKQTEVEEIAANYRKALLERHAVPEVEPLPVPQISKQQIEKWESEEETKKRIDEIQRAYKKKLAENMQAKKKDPDFERRVQELKRLKEKDWGKLSDSQWRERQKIRDFKAAQSTAMLQFRTPIMKEVVEVFNGTVDIHKLREEVKKELEAGLLLALPGDKDSQEIALENCVREIMDKLQKEWLEIELQEAAREQFKAFYITYPDAFAKENYEQLFDEKFAEVQRSRVNSDPVQAELRARLKAQHLEGQESEILTQFNNAAIDLRKQHGITRIPT